MNINKKRRTGNMLSTIYAASIYTFFYIPICIMVVFSFNDQLSNTSWVGFTFKYYYQLLNNLELMQTLGTTLLIALSSAAVALLIGTLGALALCRFHFRGKSIISNAMYVPIIFPEVVTAVMLLSVMSIVGLPRGLIAVILGHTTLVLPYVILSVKTSLSNYDLSIEEASMDLGASQRYTFFHITLPLIMPGVLSGGFLAFTLSLDNLVITDFLAGPRVVTLPIKVFSLIKVGISPQINALYTLIILFIAVGIIVKKLVSLKRKNHKS